MRALRFLSEIQELSRARDLELVQSVLEYQVSFSEVLLRLRWLSDVRLPGELRIKSRRCRLYNSL